MAMKYISLSIMLWVCTMPACASNLSSDIKSDIAKSVGRIILIHDKTWRYEDKLYVTGDFHVSKQIETEYTSNIAHLPVELRIQYFWSIMMHVNLDASFLEDFLLLIKSDCGKEYIERLDVFLRKSKELQIDGPDQEKARKYKLVLLNINP